MSNEQVSTEELIEWAQEKAEDLLATLGDDRAHHSGVMLDAIAKRLVELTNLLSEKKEDQS